MITIDSVTRTYGDFTAVDDVSFTAQPGRVTGFLGPNGAGKSTTMRIIVGLTKDYFSGDAYGPGVSGMKIAGNVGILTGMLLIESGVDPIKVTEYSIVLSAAALPLTYFPILVVSNDPAYMGEKTNGPILNAIATFYLVLIVIVAIATIPLMIITKGGT